MLFDASKKYTINELKKIAISLTNPLEKDAFCRFLQKDSRKGAQALYSHLLNRAHKEAVLVEKLDEMQSIEKSLRDRGKRLICGIDEVGRGPLAGPVVAAAVILPEDSSILGIDDSKRLSQSKRKMLDLQIRDNALDIRIGLQPCEVIDEINILQATKLAMSDAVNVLSVKPDVLLIDALTISSEIPVKSIVHGDALCYAIAAASIVAKVYRDTLMEHYAQLYPEYGFDQNKGYGTASHIEAIKKYGPCPIHRRSFIKNL